MRLLADTNIVSLAVEALRARAHDLIYVAERDIDPGDLAILGEAYASNRVFLTKDQGIGALVFRDRAAHAGVLLIDDLGSPQDETRLLSEQLELRGTQLAAGAFARAGSWGSRIATGDE